MVDDEDNIPKDLTGMLGDDATADRDAEGSVDDKLASEWAAVDGEKGASGESGTDSGTDGGEGAPISARVLSQDEIDSLLGFSE